MIQKVTKKRWKQVISIVLSFLVMLTGIPFIPGGGLPKAHAGTTVTASSTQINAVYGEKTDIGWIYTDPARDPITNAILQPTHPTDVKICQGGTRSMLSGVDKAVLVHHTVTWDGQVEVENGTDFALDGIYTACVTPTDFSEESSSVDITVFNPNPPAPTHLEMLPNYNKANNDPHYDPERLKTSHKIRGLAEVGTEVTLYYTRVYREGIQQIEDPTERVLTPVSGKIFTKPRESAWAQGIPITPSYFNDFPTRTDKTPGSLVGEWEAEVDLKENEIYKITAVAKRIRGGKESHHSAQYNILRHDVRDNNVTWEALAGYYYVKKTVPEMVATGKMIATTNILPFKPCLGVPEGCPGLIDKGWQLLMYDPKWAGTYESEELDYLTSIEKITNPDKYPRPIGLDPINLATGDFVFSHTNISLQARFPLEFEITYHSRDTFNGALGYGWRHTYEWRLERRAGETIAVTTAEGASYEYTPLGDGTYKPPLGTYNTLKRLQDGTYLLEMPNHWNYLFRQDGVLLSITNPNGNQVNLTYTGSVLEGIHTEGAGLNLYYGDAGKIERIVDQAGREVRYTYDIYQHDLKSVTLPDGGTMKFKYDPNHRITEIRNPNDTASLVNVYNEEGKVKEQTDFRGVKGYISYDTENKQTKVTDELGRVKTYSYDERYRQTAIAYPEGSSEHFEYDHQDNMTLHTDRNGNTRRFSYDLQGNLEQVVDPIGAVTSMKYNEWNQPWEITDALGNKTTIGYDGKGNMETITNALGEVSRINRDGQGVPTSIVNPKGETVVLTNYSNGFVEFVTDPLGYKKHLKRDGLNRVTDIVDALGQVSSIEYDSRDRVTAKIDALHNREEFQYDKDSNLKYHKDAAGAESHFTYEFDRIKTVTDSLSKTTEFFYDAIGNMTRKVAPNGAETEYLYNNVNRVETMLVKDKNEQGEDITLVTEFRYDGNGNLIWTKDPKGGITEIHYDERNLPDQVKDASGAITTYTYDHVGRLTRETNALGHGTTYGYDAVGRLVKVTDALNASTSFEYDKAGRLTKTIKPNGAVWEMFYDARGLLTSTKDPLGNTTSLERDELGRVRTSSDESGATTQYGYNALGFVTSIVDAMNQATSMNYDPLGRLKSITDAKQQTTSYDYDPLGRLTSVTNALQARTSYTYDAVGNITSKTDALMRVTGYEYNNRNQLVKQINPLNQLTQLSYDSNGNVDHIKYPDNKLTAYQYDPMNRLMEISYSDGKKVNYAYDAIGRRTSMNDSTGTTSYAYDALNRLTQVTNGANQTIGYEWTPTGQRSKVVYPDQTAVTYQYDLLDRMTGVTDASGLTTSYTYDKRGLLTQKNLPTQGVSTYQYDALGQVLNIRHANQHGKVVEQLQYAYDPVGNRSRMERVEDGNDEDDLDSGDHPESMITEYAYDALNQLTQVKQYNQATAATPALTSYSYDAVGNRLTKQSTWDTLSNLEQYSYDPADKLLHWLSGSNYKDFTYDPRGNLLKVIGIDNLDDTAVTSLSSMNGWNSVTGGVYDWGTVASGVYGNNTLMSSATTASPELIEEYIWDSSNRLKQHRSAKKDISQFFYDGDGNRTKMIVDVKHGPTDHSNGNGQGNGNGNSNNNNGNGNGKCHEVPPGFIPPGLAKKCGQVEEPYPDMHPGGPREGWEPQFKKKHWEFNYTNDVSLALPEPLQVTDKDQLNGTNDFYRWKETYTYGAGGERISMTYLPAYDKNNGWDPHDGTAGAEKGVAPRTLWYLNDTLGSAVGLIEKDGRVSSRYHYDEFGIPTDAKKFDVNWPGPDNLFGYTGLGYDYYSGMSYARARYYKPELGRFVSEDTYKGALGNSKSQNGYAYVWNNPLRYIDPSGYIPTVREAAVMAQNIYGATEKDATDKKIVVGGWTIIDILRNGEGLKIGVYSSVKADGTTEYALVNKGSSTKGDWVNNIQQPYGYSDDMKDSISKSSYFVANNKDSEITMVGHSKGGAEAVVNAVANNLNAITFNPAIPKLDEYGLSDEDYTASVKNYVVTREVLNDTFGEVPTGTTYYLPQQVFFDENNVREKTWYNGGAVLYDRASESARVGIANHSMDSVISALLEDGHN
ncbi:DUF6531 domain-containing protein [Paenibacillus sedimenti]|uniref:RHS repeat-associated core domain-containing protein n=1 Tax=Paenibacillus sedimenti TaxID=2770274 RepID=A0A926KM68_9BACL|nr:DUF6531 domain-containing protein [Paenibacillus sedimenti]MBD0379576.1 RHS repeat-associated core domain-containing protein [Paenibacillus sedimenti]